MRFPHVTGPFTLSAGLLPAQAAKSERTAGFRFVQTTDPMTFDKDADTITPDDDDLRQAVVVRRDPVLDGRALTYKVDIIDGEMPEKGADPSVFIDIIGMPLTPVSYVGVAREVTAGRAFVS